MGHIIEAGHDAVQQVIKVRTVLGRTVSLDDERKGQGNSKRQQRPLFFKRKIYLATESDSSSTILTGLSRAKGASEEDTRYTGPGSHLTHTEELLSGLDQSQTNSFPCTMARILLLQDCSGEQPQ